MTQFERSPLVEGFNATVREFRGECNLSQESGANTIASASLNLDMYDYALNEIVFRFHRIT